jgi:hypothetical protein
LLLRAWISKRKPHVRLFCFLRARDTKSRATPTIVLKLGFIANCIVWQYQHTAYLTRQFSFKCLDGGCEYYRACDDSYRNFACWYYLHGDTPLYVGWLIMG